MTRRYYCESLPASGGLVQLSKEEAGHAIRVMRIQKGESVTLFDGADHESEAVIESVSRNECVCRSRETIVLPRMPPSDLTIAVALPKPDRAKELVERLTELGVTSVVPINADRTQRPPSSSLMQKLSRVVIEACKQSGRNRLMQIHSPVPSIEFFNDHSDREEATSLIAHVSEDSAMISSLLNGIEPSSKTRYLVAIGPEGGWTDEEAKLAMNSGFAPVSLGQRVYRIETAAAAVASIIGSV